MHTRTQIGRKFVRRSFPPFGPMKTRPRGPGSAKRSMRAKLGDQFGGEGDGAPPPLAARVGVDKRQIRHDQGTQSFDEGCYIWDGGMRLWDMRC